jgi:hypothetical protein
MTQAIEIINAWKVDYLKKAIDKLNRKAAKLGCDPMVLTFGPADPYKTAVHPITGHKLVNPMVIERVTATLDYEIPNIDGWELVAVLDIYSTENASEVMVSAVPDMIVPDEYKNLDRISCDHCGHNRYRKKSILIRNIETGEHKQVGSTCVKDFFNGNDPKGFMFMAGILFDHLVANISDEECFKGGRFNAGGFEFLEVLNTTAAVVKKFGFTSKKAAWDYGYQSTADRVWDNLCPPPHMTADDYAEATEADLELAKKTLAYFTDIDAGNNDYLLNIKKIISLGFVPFKYMGFACSMVSSYQRAVEKEAIYKAKKKLGENSVHVGQIGERLRDIQVKVLSTRDIESDYGLSVLYTFQDDAGNLYKTFYSGSSWSADVDDVLLITGTVKKHEDFRGTKSTMLNRVAASAAAFSDDEFAVA